MSQPEHLTACLSPPGLSVSPQRPEPPDAGRGLAQGRSLAQGRGLAQCQRRPRPVRQQANGSKETSFSVGRLSVSVQVLRECCPRAPCSVGPGRPHAAALGLSVFGASLGTPRPSLWKVPGPRLHPPSAVQTCRLLPRRPAICSVCQPRPNPRAPPPQTHLGQATPPHSCPGFPLRFPLRSCCLGLLSHSRAGWPPRAGLIQSPPQPPEVGAVTPFCRKEKRGSQASDPGPRVIQPRAPRAQRRPAVFCRGS